MAAQKFDFSRKSCGGRPCEVGASFSYRMTWEAETSVGSGLYLPVDLTGYSAKMQVRKDVGTAVIVELSTTNGRITLGGVFGTIDLLIAPSVTAVLPAGLFKYDLDLTDANGFKTRFVEGFFEIEGAITV